MKTPRISILSVMILATLVAFGAVAQEADETTEAPEAAPTSEAAPEPEPEPAATTEPEPTGPVSLSFETTVDFELVKSIALDGRAGEIEFRGVEFIASSAKGGVFGTSDADIKTNLSVMLDCSTEAEKKAKFDLTIQFLDGEGTLVDRITVSASFKSGSKTLEFKHTTLKYAVPMIKTAKITAVAKGK
jgi:hypothetical protein